jgi:hypothetical protein
MDTNAVVMGLVQNVANLLYAKCQLVGEPHIEVAYSDLKERHRENFVSAEECSEAWTKPTYVLTRKLSSPCIPVGNTLFQPAHLLRIIQYTDERGYFIILDFGNDRNLWMVYRDALDRQRTYLALLAVLGIEAGEAEKKPQTIN